MRALLAVDAAHRTQIHAALIQRGWRVTAAATAAEAQQRFLAAPYPLVVLSDQLPDADGVSVCRAVRSSTLGRAAYVIMVHPLSVPATVRAVAEAGVDDLLTTPMAPAVLAMRLAFAEYRLGTHPGGSQGEERTASFAERVTELEHALRVERASLNELFQSAPEGIVVVDEQDRVVRLNGEFTRMFGYSQAEAVGRPANELIVPPHLAEQATRITRGVVQGERFALETVRRRRDGTLIDVSLLATPIRVGNGSIGAYGIYRDITQRKAGERALAESEARYRTLFDQSPVGVFVCDAELRITHCNERLSQMMGCPAKQIVGGDLRDHRSVGLLAGLRTPLPGETAFYDGRYRRGDTELWIAVRLAPLRDPDGAVMGAVGVVEDMTEREQAGQRLRQQAAELERVNLELRQRTAELEAAMQERSRLYTAINHELRTPISAIMLHQELLISGALGDLPDEQMRALRHSHTAAQHFLDLVNDLLDLSKIEAGKMTVQPAEVTLPNLLQETVEALLPLVRRHGSELRLDLAPALPVVVTDAQRVRQILFNLLSNAAKFGRGRPIVMRCHAARPGEVSIEVQDHGIGIAEADLELIFEDFAQVGRVQHGGTGLGLAISHRLATLLQGRLEVQSTPGEGSTFRLVIPIAAPGPAREERRPADG